MTATLSQPQALATEVPKGRPTGQWGMFGFVATEAMFFACLLGAYFYVRFTHGGPWPPDGIEKPKLLKAFIMLALLLASSGTMVLADLSIRRGKSRRMTWALVVTLLLGAGFLYIQSGEYAENLKKFTWTKTAYASFFYTITGFHGTHVAIGLCMIAWLIVAAARGKFTKGRHERVRMVSIYWHFVDVVWVFIVFGLYISPHLGG